MAKKPNWQNRIIESGIEDADQLLANPFNARIHPQFQQQALEGVLDSIGWVQRVIVNKTTGHVVDGHLRVALAITHNEQVPVDYVELTEDEEKAILASFDYITTLAAYDKDQLDSLLKQVNSDDARVQELLSKLAIQTGVIPPDNPYDEWVGMPKFEQDDLSAAYSIRVNFNSLKDLQNFARLVSQTITENTRSIWYPQRIDSPHKDERYISA